jgi:predicted negative regulator of RcsB-dependent stress response
MNKKFSDEIKKFNRFKALQVAMSNAMQYYEVEKYDAAIQELKTAMASNP